MTNKQQLFKQAENKHRQGDLAGALTLYQDLLKISPQNADAWHQIGIIYAQQGQNKSALDAINKAIHIKADFAPFYNSKGNLLIRIGEQDDAISAYQTAVKIDPRYAIAYTSLGRCYTAQGQLLSARKSYEKAIELAPNLASAHTNYGLLLAKLGEHELAINTLKQSLKLNPSQAAAEGQLAQIYLQQGDFEQAIKHLKQRLHMQPEHIDSWYDLGLAYLEQQQYKEAITYLEKVLQLNPNHPECQHYLASAYLQSGDRSKALTYFLRQISVQPLADSFYNIGVLMMAEERHRESIEYFKKNLEMDAQYLPAHLNLGALYLKLKQSDNAAKHYQLAHELKPNDAEIKHILTALKQDQVPDKAPDEYLKNLFDQYAHHYDKHLTEYLHYTVPQQLHQAITLETGISSPEWRILDLGCGTGLCGELFKEFASELIGIDISKEMINSAKAKNIYDQLEVADIEKALANYHDIDLILAADVFTYIGNLKLIFTRVNNALTSKGLFAFSVEKTSTKPYELQQTIRYAHSRHYLEQLISEHHFDTLNFDNIILRKQKK